MNTRDRIRGLKSQVEQQTKVIDALVDELQRLETARKDDKEQIEKMLMDITELKSMIKLFNVKER